MIKKIKYALVNFFLVSLVLGFSKGIAQEPLLLSLGLAENIAIQNNYKINASLHRLEQGYYGYRASRAYFKPQLSFASQVDIAQEDNSLNAILNLTQPLYDKVAFYQLKEAEIQWEMFKIEVQQQICEILFEVRNAYFTVLLNQAHLVIDQAVIGLWEEELKRQERFLELGASIPFDLNQARLHLKRARSDFFDTEGEIRTSQIRLLAYLGLAPTTPLKLTEMEIPPPVFDPEKNSIACWNQLAFRYRPQLKQEQFSFLLSQNKVRQTKAEKLPTLSFYANAGNRYINNGFSGQPYVGTGLNLDWALYDPTNKPRMQQAEEGRKEAASNYYQAELETEAIIYALLNEMDRYFLAYQNAQEEAVLADQGIKMAVRKHQTGMMSSFEYRDTIETFHEAQQQMIQAKFDFHHAYNRLIQETGLDISRECYVRSN